MKKTLKLRLLTIFIYLIPILIVLIVTQKSSYFLLCAGIMTIVLGLSMKFIPNYIGYKKEMDKINSPIFIIIAGIMLIISANMR